MSPMKDSSALVLVSGGIDSAILLLELSKQYHKVYPLFIQQGLLWEKAERYWLKKLLRTYFSKKRGVQPLTLLKLPLSDVYEKHWSLTGEKIPDQHSLDEAVFLPGRNIILLAKAALFCHAHQIQTISIGILKGNPFPDSSPSFFKNLSKLFSTALSYPLTVITPFSKYSKADIMKKRGDLPLEWTFSCIHPQKGNRHCGDCNKCAERKRVFRKIGEGDPTLYAGTDKG